MKVEDKLGRMVLRLALGFLRLVTKLGRDRGRFAFKLLYSMALICGVTRKFMDVKPFKRKYSLLTS